MIKAGFLGALFVVEDRGVLWKCCSFWWVCAEGRGGGYLVRERERGARCVGWCVECVFL